MLSAAAPKLYAAQKGMVLALLAAQRNSGFRSAVSQQTLQVLFGGIAAWPADVAGQAVRV